MRLQIRRSTSILLYTKKGPLNFLDIFIYHSLYGNTLNVKRKEVNENMKCITVNVFAKSGVIAHIKGTSKIEKMEDCTLSLVHGHVGQQCDDSKAILDKIYVFAFSNTSAEKLKKMWIRLTIY